MSDIVDEKLELRLIDTRQLVEEAKKLKEAKRIKEEQNKLLKKDPNQLREEKELLKRLKEGKKKPLTSSSAPTPFIGEEGPTLPNEAKKQTRTGAIKGQNTFNAFREAQKKIKELERKQKQDKKQSDKFKNDVMNKVINSQNIFSGEIGLGDGAAILSRFGPIGMAIAAIAVPIITQLQKQFQRGGVFSIFLKEKVQAKTIIDEDELNLARSGNKFLTSDLRIVQGIPQSSNTQNIKYEHIRFTAQTLGQ